MLVGRAFGICLVHQDTIAKCVIRRLGRIQKARSLASWSERLISLSGWLLPTLFLDITGEQFCSLTPLHHVVDHTWTGISKTEGKINLHSFKFRVSDIFSELWERWLQTLHWNQFLMPIYLIKMCLSKISTKLICVISGKNEYLVNSIIEMLRKVSFLRY